MPFTWLDIALIGVMLISGILALMRGFTREVLSIISWIGAAAAAFAVWFSFPELKGFSRQYIQPDELADAVLALGAFIIVLIILSTLTAKLSDRILDSDIGALDRTLGFLFGAARGLVLVVIAFLLFDWLVPRAQHPSWVRHARTMPLIQSTADTIIDYLPESAARILRKSTTEPGQTPNPAPGTPPATPPGTPQTAPPDNSPASPDNTQLAPPRGKLRQAGIAPGIVE